VSADDIPAIINGTLRIYKRCALDTTKWVIKNWVVLPGGIALFFIFVLASQLLAPMGFLGGFLLGILYAMALSLYYSWILATKNKDPLNFANLFEFDMPLFWNIINVGFVFWIFFLFYDQLTKGFNVENLNLGIGLLIGIIFNPLPEIIMHHRMDGTGALSHSYNFIRENWIEWFLPVVLFSLPYWWISPWDMLMNFITRTPLIPVLSALQPWLDMFRNFVPGIGSLVAFVVSLLLAHWFMVFRLNLFAELDGSNRRRRRMQGK
jgi:hypothetical protein